MDLRDQYSNFNFFNALPSDVYSTDTNGRTIDLQGYGAATVIVNAHSLASAGAMSADNAWYFVLQHGLASDNGVSAWSNVPNSLLIHSTYGGYQSTGETGIFAALTSGADAALSTQTYFVGYKGDPDHRYLRVQLSNVGAASTMWAAGLAVLGNPANWPVNETVGD